MESQSRFELVMCLKHSGWEVSNQLQASHCYIPDSEQEFTLAGGLYHEYLLCLLNAHALWKVGLPAIYHLQSKTYYSSMLALFKVGSALALQTLQQYQPGLSANAYKDLVKATDNDQQTRSKKRQSVRDLIPCVGGRGRRRGKSP